MKSREVILGHFGSNSDKICFRACLILSFNLKKTKKPLVKGSTCQVRSFLAVRGRSWIPVKVGKSVEERKKQKIEIENWGNFYDQTDLDKFSSEFNDIAEEVYKTEETQPPTQGQFNRIVLCQIHF